MRLAPALILVLAVGLASGCGSARQDRAQPLLAYSNGLDLVLYDPATASRRILVAGDPGSELDYEDAGVWLDEPAWSPDGKRLAYVRFGKSVRVQVADVASGRRRSVTHALGDWGSGYDPRWSSDGRWIAYRDQGRGELWVARSDTRRERLVLRNRRDRIGILGWTPNGRLVIRVGVLGRSRDDRGALVVRSWERLVVRPDGGRPRPFGEGWPSPSLGPDGRRLAIERDASGNDQVVVLAANRSVDRLTADRPLPGRLSVRSSSPRWSPDGRWVAFGRGGAVVVVRADSSRERRVLEDGSIAGWSPDGRYLLVAGSLGARSLWLFEPQSGRRTLVSRAFGRGGVLFEPGGAAWRPQDAPRVASMAPGRPVPHAVETPFPSSSFGKGRVRIGYLRPLGAPALSRADDLSPDGRFAAVTTRIGRYTAQLEVLDLTNGSRRWIGTLASPWAEGARFDPSGRELLFRRWRQLWRAGLTGGSPRLVARDAGPGPYRWLRGGRIAYVDRRRRLVIVDGAAVKRVPLGLAQAADGLAVSPDGERVLYARGCDVWLENLRTGRARRFAHARFSPTPESWSPRGDRIALAVSRYWPECTAADFGWYHSNTALFDLRGERLDLLPGRVVDWSADGRFLVTSGGVTGSSVGTAQPLVLDDLRARRQSTLMPAASTGQAWVLSGGRIVFGRYDNPLAIEKGGDFEPRLYSGRLVPTGRRG